MWLYRWDAAGLLREVERPDGVEVRFAYDPFARRVAKEVREPRGALAHDTVSRTRFVWDGDVLAHEIREEASASGDPVVEERTYLYEDDSFEPVAHAEVGRWVHYLNDQIGTPERLLDDAGAVACELRRSAWGETDVQPGAKANTPIRFQGQYEDEETGLSYNRARYYDGDLGRFTSADPLGLSSSPHDYVYAPSTLGWVDAWGLAKAKKPGGYHTYDVDEHSRLSPQANRAPGHKNTRADKYVQSHHGIQHEWAKKNVKGYSRSKAPAILLPSASGEAHAKISTAQANRRACQGYGSDIRSEFNQSYEEMIAAGVPPAAAKKAMKKSYKYYDSLGAFS